MTIADGYIITASDLETIWSPVSLQRQLVPSQRSENVISAVFDDGYNTWDGETQRASYIDWIPVSDCYLLGATALAATDANSGTNTFTIEIESAAQGVLYTATCNVVNATSTRTNLSATFESRIISVQAGDLIKIKFTGTTAPNAIELCRVHILYENLWSST